MTFIRLTWSGLRRPYRRYRHRWRRHGSMYHYKNSTLFHRFSSSLLSLADMARSPRRVEPRPHNCGHQPQPFRGRVALSYPADPYNLDFLWAGWHPYRRLYSKPRRYSNTGRSQRRLPLSGLGRHRRPHPEGDRPQHIGRQIQRNRPHPNSSKWCPKPLRVRSSEAESRYRSQRRSGD